MADYTIMSWNVQNIFEQKASTPAELAAEPTTVGGGQRRARIVEASTKLYDTYGINLRGTVCGIVQRCDPDIFILIELTVGKNDLQSGGNLVSSQVEFESYAADNILVDLNGRAHPAPWQMAQSNVNAADLVAAATAASGVNVASKNTIFEQYAIFWKTSKFDYIPPAAQAGQRPRIEILKKDQASADLPFPARRPGGICLSETGGNKNQVYIVMHHTVFGVSSKPRKDTIDYLSRLAEVHTRPHVVLAGDFNVDYITDKSAYAPLETLPMTVRNGANATCSVSAQAATLKNAYDQMFTKGIAEPQKPFGGPYDFVGEVFGDDGDKARRISDHLPIYANITLP